ncbi:hypothetical protein GCM10009603_41060 [Nocardiopsis exhalans]
MRLYAGTGSGAGAYLRRTRDHAQRAPTIARGAFQPFTENLPRCRGRRVCAGSVACVPLFVEYMSLRGMWVLRYPAHPNRKRQLESHGETRASALGRGSRYGK